MQRHLKNARPSKRLSRKRGLPACRFATVSISSIRVETPTSRVGSNVSVKVLC
jgi:hypothetical protein